MDDIVAGGSETQHINLNGIGRKQMGQSSFAGGSLKSASSRSSAVRRLHSFLCVAQCFFWQTALQYLTLIHDLHTLRLTPPSSPHSAQQLLVWFIPPVPADENQSTALIWRAHTTQQNQNTDGSAFVVRGVAVGDNSHTSKPWWFYPLL